MPGVSLGIVAGALQVIALALILGRRRPAIKSVAAANASATTFMFVST
jgi:hypothetical protein